MHYLYIGSWKLSPSHVLMIILDLVYLAPLVRATRRIDHHPCCAPFPSTPSFIILFIPPPLRAASTNASAVFGTPSFIILFIPPPPPPLLTPLLYCYVVDFVVFTFNERQMERYKEGPRGKPPHVFAVGHRAYYDMLSERKPQARVKNNTHTHTPSVAPDQRFS